MTTKPVPMRAAGNDAGFDPLLAGNLRDPFAFLGMHRADGGGLVVRVFRPDAQEILLTDADGTAVAEMTLVRQPGCFVADISDRDAPFDYRLRVTRGGGEQVVDDPYRFPPYLGEIDMHLLAEGTHKRSFDRLGAQLAEIDGITGVNFAVWAPNAQRVSVVGDFNDWDGRRHFMRLHPGCRVWEIFIPGLGPGTLYKYEVMAASGELMPLKSDPYAFRCEHPPSTASVVEPRGGYVWKDDAWMQARAARHGVEAAISVYEVHLGSWRRVPEEDNRFLTYREMIEQLVPYVKDLGFTHIELLPVNEFPFDGSWGYQPIGLFSPTSRFGPPDDFRAFVDACHQAGIGVILDWVPGHFPEDAHGLGRFDGTHLYEHADPRQGRHMDWGTLIYNFDRTEVVNFLISNALFWLEEFHIDGLRVDAVASMLYLDYSREDGQWVANKYGGNENLGAIAFLKQLNEVLYSEHPGIFTVAEESTAWPMVSRPTFLGGLGFGFKWNMGWMHDTLGYMSKDPIHRKYHHDQLTFGLLYAFQENFVLPLSHDEVVHGKRSLLGRMPGDQWQRFANLRAYLAFMWTHPGKKLLFMGGEIAHEHEWNHQTSLDWHLLGDPMHAGVQRLIGDLNRLLRDTPALYERDNEHGGFAWIDCTDHEQSVLSFLRRGARDDDFVVVVANFTSVLRLDYRVGVPRPGRYVETLNTDSTFYGGADAGNLGDVWADDTAMHGHGQSLRLTLPALSVLVLEWAGTT